MKIVPYIKEVQQDVQQELGRGHYRKAITLIKKNKHVSQR